MKPQIHAALTISEIIRRYPETRSIFVANGLGEMISNDGMRVLAPFLTLKTALQTRAINVEGFVTMLETAAGGQKIYEAPGLGCLEEQKKLSLLALMPCGLKMPFSRMITDFIARWESSSPFSIHYAVEGNLNQELSYYSYTGGIEDESELPDIIVSSDFNVFYGHNFYNRFVETGYFGGYGSVLPGKNFKDAGIMDSNGEYSVLCVNPLVIVANTAQLDGRKVPATWEDILSPVWKQSIVIRGDEQFFCHAVLLHIYQEFGAAGLKALASNISCGRHPSQMVSQIDKNSSDALYVMPEFFAQRVQHKERMRIIWPKDGAFASPVTLQTKPSQKVKLQPLLDFLTGKELAATFAAARFPVPHMELCADVQKKPLKWLGWEYMHKNDLMTVNKKIDEIFMPLIQTPREKNANASDKACHCSRPAIKR